MKKLILALVCLGLLFSCKPAKAQDTVGLPFKFNVDTAYDFQHKTLTGGLGVDAVSVYDILYVGIEGIGAPEESFFKNGLLGPQANIDINQGISKISKVIGLGDKVKWLLGKYTPRCGAAVTYNFLQNDYYKQWNFFLTLRIVSF